MSQDINSMFLALERDILDPGVSHEKRETLIASDFLEFGKSGTVWHRDSILEYLRTNLSTGRPKIQSLELSASELSPDVMLVIYRTSIDGEPGSGALRSSIWVRRSNSWQIRFHQATPSQATLGS